jgi:hypothetical protein
VLSQDGLGIRHEASLQGFILPAGGKEFSEFVSFFSHGLSPGSGGLVGLVSTFSLRNQSETSS